LKSLTVFYQKSLKFTRYNINTENRLISSFTARKWTRLVIW